MAGLHTLKRTGKRPYRRVGRGQSSTRGKQSGRGGKGQTARAGHKIRPAMRDIIKKLPKRRGFGKNRGRTFNPSKKRGFAIPVSTLARAFENGGEVTPKALSEKGILNARGQILSTIKIVGGGTLDKKLTVKGCAVSASAREAIEKAGGTLE